MYRTPNRTCTPCVYILQTHRFLVHDMSYTKRHTPEEFTWSTKTIKTTLKINESKGLRKYFKTRTCAEILCAKLKSEVFFVNRPQSSHYKDTKQTNINGLNSRSLRKNLTNVLNNILKIFLH